MEPPSKRRRLTGSSYPEVDLNARRAQNDARLKSIFESIFEKYGRDFDGIGDEIDVETGEIVVNNGHIQGMNDEKDIGDAEYSSEELEDSDYENDDSSIEYSEEYLATVGPSKARDAVVVEESEASEQSNLDADSLMGDVPANSHLHQLSKKSTRAVSIPSDDEEDELASSDIERASHNKDRLCAQERSPLLKDKCAFIDEPPIDPIWRAPPLLNISRPKMRGDKARLTSVFDMREYSDDERAGISLWTPEGKKRSQRRYDSAKSLNQHPLSFERGQENNADRTQSDLSHSEAGPRKIVRWTKEEEELLIHLKSTTNLSSTAMESYFPERQGNAVASHWTYMITCGKASPKPQVPTTLGLPSLSSSKRTLASNGSRPNSHDHDPESKPEDPQIIQQQVKGEPSEAGSLFQNSSKPIKHTGDHHNSRYQVDGDHGTPNGYTVDKPISRCDDVGADIRSPTRSAFSNPVGGNCKIVESAKQSKSNEVYDDVLRSYSLSKSLEIEDDVSMHETNSLSKLPDQGLEDVFENGCRVRISSPTTSTKADSDSKGVDSRSDSIVSPEIQSPGTTAFEASDLHRQQPRSHAGIQREESVRPIAEDNVQMGRSTAEGLRKTRSTNLDLTTPEQPPDHGTSSASHEPTLGVSSKNLITRQIVQVVIPLAAKRNLIMKHVATTETEGGTFIRQLSELTETVPTAPGPSSPHQENTAIRTPTRSPSVVAAESQHAASAAFLFNEVRSSLGPEIADSQSLSTTPAVASSAPEFERGANRPINLDPESPPLSTGLGVAPSARKQLKKATKNIVLKSGSRPLRVNPGKLTPARNLIEEAKESDVVESGSHPLNQKLSAARSLSKRVKKETIAEALSPIRTAIDDYSEDELSYL